jgi:hypothetical protein
MAERGSEALLLTIARCSDNCKEVFCQQFLLETVLKVLHLCTRSQETYVPILILCHIICFTRAVKLMENVMPSQFDMELKLIHTLPSGLLK